MLQVQILDRCPFCKGQSMVFVAKDVDQNGKPYDRYRPCSMCHGSGNYPKWVSLEEFSRMMKQVQCTHKHASKKGGMHFSGGDVWDDIQEVCDDCGETLD